MAWIGISIMSTALALVMISAFLKREGNGYLHLLLSRTHALGALILFFFIDADLFSTVFSAETLYPLLSIAMLLWLSKIMAYAAYGKITVANVTVFSALTPVYSALLAPFFALPLSKGQALGIGIICISLMLFFSKPLCKGRGMRVTPALPLALAALSTFPTALSTYFQKTAILASGPIAITFFICCFTAAISAAFTFMPGQCKTLEKKQYTFILAIALLQVTAALSFSVFLADHHPAEAQALSRLSGLLQIALAHLLLKERLDTGWHLLCMSLALAGAYALTV